MPAQNVTRRRVLRNAVAGVAATGIAGTALTHSTGRTIVGLTADAGFGVARQHADTVSRELDFGAIGKAVSGTFSEQAIQALEANPNVRYVEDDGLMYALQKTPWNIERVRAPVAHDHGDTGRGASIAILDTGVQVDHEDLRVVGGAAFGSSCSTCPEPYGDDNGHGTHCAGIACALDNEVGVIGVAPEVDLYSVKVLDSNGSGSFSDIAAGVQWVADQGINVASMSFGGSSDSSTLRDALEYAHERGTFLVAAAGGSDGDITYPAVYEEVMAVGGTDENDDVMASSPSGPEIEIVAPGSNIYSTSNDDGYTTLTGTSMACPHVAGGGALVMANGSTNEQARQQLKDGADDICHCPEEQGAGRLNVAAALGHEEPDECDNPPNCDDCFITTATAGEGETLDSLRRFRDESMAATPLGRGMVGLYYRISPPIADTLARHPESRTTKTCHRIVELCGSLSDAQNQTDSRVKRASLGGVLTALYVVGIVIGAGGHTGITARELLE